MRLLSPREGAVVSAHERMKSASFGGNIFQKKGRVDSSLREKSIDGDGSLLEAIIFYAYYKKLLQDCWE